MTTTTKSADRYELLREPELNYPGVLFIETAAGKCFYLIDPARSDFGTAFRLRRLGRTEVYHVHPGEDGTDTCECKGAVYRGKCKHLDAVRHLRGDGRL